MQSHVDDRPVASSVPEPHEIKHVGTATYRAQNFSSSQADGWRTAFEECEKTDKRMVEEYREEIDSLLVFVRK
jgi:hypothetical protein